MLLILMYFHVGLVRVKSVFGLELCRYAEPHARKQLKSVLAMVYVVKLRMGD